MKNTTMDAITRFIIIDDDVFNNTICTVTIAKTATDAEIKTFLDPISGFDYIVEEYGRKDQNGVAVLFLDINMPVMDGWQFLDKFAKLDERIKERVKIYILSSSVDKRDIQRAKENKYVKHYLVKPLTKETIRLVIYSLNRGIKK